MSIIYALNVKFCVSSNVNEYIYIYIYIYVICSPAVGLFAVCVYILGSLYSRQLLQQRYTASVTGLMLVKFLSLPLINIVSWRLQSGSLGLSFTSKPPSPPHLSVCIVLPAHGVNDSSIYTRRYILS